MKSESGRKKPLLFFGLLKNAFHHFYRIKKKKPGRFRCAAPSVVYSCFPTNIAVRCTFIYKKQINPNLLLRGYGRAEAIKYTDCTFSPIAFNNTTIALATTKLGLPHPMKLACKPFNIFRPIIRIILSILHIKKLKLGEMKPQSGVTFVVRKNRVVIKGAAHRDFWPINLLGEF